MRSPRRTDVVATLAASLVVLAGPAARSQSGPGEPLQVTSDTQQFCNEVAARVQARQEQRSRLGTPPDPDAATLETEGRTMCDQGHVRAGLTRLRMAWVLLNN